MIKFDGTLNDWLFVFVVIAVYLAGKSVGRPVTHYKGEGLTHREKLRVLTVLAIYKASLKESDSDKIEDINKVYKKIINL